MKIRAFVMAVAVASLAAGSASAVVQRHHEKGVAISDETVESIKEADKAMEAKDYAKAVEKYSEAIAAKELEGENLSGILLNRGLAYMSLKQCVEANADFTASIAATEKPSASAYAGLGQCNNELGKTADAIAAFKQAAALAPTEATFVGAYCSAAFNGKAYAEAGPACEAYLAFVPTDKQILEATAVSYQHAGNKAKALEIWKKLLALDPASAVAKQGIEQNS